MKKRRIRNRKWAAKEEPFTFAGVCHITGKVIFPNRKAAKKNRKHYNDDSEVFLCYHCNGIHLGHAGGYDRGQHREWHAMSSRMGNLHEARGTTQVMP